MPYDDLDDDVEARKVGTVFAIVLLAVAIAVILFLTSCTVGYATGVDGTKTFVGAVGGKGAAKSKQLAMNWDNEKSFNDVAIVALAAVPAIQAVKIAQSADKLTAVESTNAASVTKHLSTEHTKEVLGLSETAAGVTKATTANPNVISH